MKVLLSSIFLLLFSISPLLSQSDCDNVPPIVLNIEIVPDPGSAPNVFPGDDFCINITAENFNMVEVFQLNIGFDPTFMEFIPNASNPEIGSSIVSLAEVDTNPDDTELGLLPIIFQQSGIQSITLADGETVFTVCFEALDRPGECSDISTLPSSAINFGEFETFATVRLADGTPCNIDVNFNQDEEVIKIGCEQLSVSNLDVCQGSGCIEFGSCGGTFPVTYQLENTPLTGTFDSDADRFSACSIPPGIYNIILIDAAGARVDRPVILNDNIDPIALSETIVDPTCNDRNNGIINFDISGGTGDYNVLLSNGVNLQDDTGSISNLPNGSYGITVTDSEGCREVFGSFDLFTPALEIATVAVDSFECLGDTLGSVIITASGGTPFPNNEYNINNVQTTTFTQDDPMGQTFEFIEQDTCFEVTIEDANGCQLIECVRLPIRNSFVFDFDTIPPSCSDLGYRAEININDSFRYLFILFGQGGTLVPTAGNNSFQIAQDLEPGEYVWVLERLGSPCVERIRFTIPPFTMEAPVMLTSTATQPDCGMENGIATVMPSGGTGNFSYEWEFDPTIDAPTLAGLPSGLYTVTVTDEAGCTEEETVDLQQGVFLNIDAVINQDLDCTDPSISAELEVLFTGQPVADLMFNWFTAGEANLGADPVLVTDTAGVYIVEVTNIAGTCMLSDTVEIIETSDLNFRISPVNPALCDPTNPMAGSITIDNITGGSGFYVCRWELNGLPLPPPTNVDCFRDDLGAGTYDITVIDNTTGCRTTVTQVLTDNDDVAFTPTLIEPDCPESATGQISLAGIAGGPDLTCVWEDTSISVANCVASNLEDGDYIVTISDANGCTTVDTFTLEDPVLFEAEIIDSVGVSCNDGNDGMATVNITANPQGLTDFIYLWNGVQSTMTGEVSTQMDLPSGPNTLTIVANNCDISLDFSIPEPPLIVLDNRNEVVMTNCGGECSGAIDLQASGGTSALGDYTYTWLFDGAQMASRDDLCPGVFQILIEDDNGCTIMDSIEVLDADSLFFNLGALANVDCNGTGGRIEVIASGGCDGFSYEWTDNVSTTETAEDLVPGDYAVTVTDACGCTQMLSVTVDEDIPIFAELDFRSEALCAGDRICLGIDTTTISGGTGMGYTFTINRGIDTPLIPVDSCVSIIPGPTAISVFDSGGCELDFGIVDLPGPPELSVDIGPQERTAELGEDPLEFFADITASTTIVDISWIPESIECIDPTFCDEAIFNALENTTVSVIVTDENGCTAVDDAIVEVEAVRRVFVPQAFLPESILDDRFMIFTGRGVQAIQDFLIYDRWGNLVFELPEEDKPFPHSKDDGWDGRFDNQEAQAGVYAFLANVLFEDGEVIQYSGQITLLR